MSTPFGHLLNIPTLCINRAILDFIVQNWDVDRCGVSYLGRFIRFRPKDVALVLGLKCHDSPVDFYSGGNYDDYERLHGVEKLSVSSARNIFERLVKDNTDAVDVVRVFVLIVFLEFLFVSTSGGLNKPFLKFIGDVNLLGTFAWALVVHRYLVDSVNNCATRSKERSSSVTHYVGGCTLALVGWFKEATTGHEPTNL